MEDRFKEGIQYLTAVPESRFAPFLERIITKAHLKNQSTFTPIELRKLEKIFNLNSKALQALLAACLFLVEHAARAKLSGNALADILDQGELPASKVEAFLEVWESEGKRLIERLDEQLTSEKEFSISDHFDLTGADWRLNLQVADSVVGRKLEPTGVLQLQLQPISQARGGSHSSNIHLETTEPELLSRREEVTQPLAIEFSYDELTAYYEKLQRIQEQLDATSRS